MNRALTKNEKVRLMNLANIEARIGQLMRGDDPPDGTARDAFIDLCEVSLRVFDGMPDAVLATNLAAGPLLRYLLHAMRGYLDARPDNLNTPKAREALAKAFGVEARKRGAQHTRITAELVSCEIYRKALHGGDAVDVAGHMKPNAHDIALRAMFKATYRREPMNDSEDAARKRGLEALLRKHGYLLDAEQRASNRRALE